MEQEVDFDFHEEFIDMIEDKSLNCLRSDLPCARDNNKLKYIPVPPSTSRRVLIVALSRKEIDIEKILHNYERRGPL